MPSPVLTRQDSNPSPERSGRAHDRTLRLLHIGNIANNAYLNAKLLRSVGIESDVIVYDYYHIMGCPEWEDADFDEEINDHVHPDWSRVDLRGFERPRWFVQGPLHKCIEYLLAQRGGDTVQADRLWETLKWGRNPEGKPPGLVHRAARRAAYRGRILAAGLGRRAARSSRRAARCLARLAHLAPHRPGERATQPGGDDAARAPDEGEGDSAAPFDFEWLARAFATAFAGRRDRLRRADVSGYEHIIASWNELFRHYDVVVGYATDGVLPLLAGKRPYFTYEHGTIRNIPFQETTQGRLCALTYRLADLAFITNCDNIDAAQRLGIPRHRFVPHPVNEAPIDTARVADLRRSITDRFASDFVLFHPARHHWEDRRHPDWEKGNDILIRGFAEFVRMSCPTACAVFVDWGKTVDASKMLLKELGISDRVCWIPPQPNRRMAEYIKASDAVADQFFLGAFGSLTPKALLHGCPVLLHLDEARHRWCLPELPPVINVNTPAGVAEGLSRLVSEPGLSQKIVDMGQTWYRQYHSNEVIANVFLDSIHSHLPVEESAD